MQGESRTAICTDDCELVAAPRRRCGAVFAPVWRRVLAVWDSALAVVHSAIRQCRRHISSPSDALQPEHDCHLRCRLLLQRDAPFDVSLRLSCLVLDVLVSFFESSCAVRFCDAVRGVRCCSILLRKAYDFPPRSIERWLVCENDHELEMLRLSTVWHRSDATRNTQRQHSHVQHSTHKHDGVQTASFTAQQ